VDSVVFPFIVDTGATLTLISKNQARAISRRTGNPLVPLEKSLRVQTAAYGEAGVLRVFHQLTSDIVLQSPSGQQLHVPAVTMYVTQGLADTEVLVGRDLQRRVGFNISEVLDSLWRREPLPQLEPAWYTHTTMLSGTDFDSGAAPTGPRVPVPSTTAQPVALRVRDAAEDPDEDPGEAFPLELLAVDVDEVQAVVLAKLDMAAQAAAAIGSAFSSAQMDRLRAAVVGEFADLWRLQLAADPPADVEPIRMEVSPDVRKVRHGQRRYSKEDSAFMAAITDKLERFGLIRRNPFATVVSPAHPVKKADADPRAPPESQRRLTFDYRAVNAHTVPVHYPIPRLETFAEIVGGAAFFGTVDLANGYWQVPLHPDSQDFLSFRTDAGVFTPTRLPQGARTAVGLFQATMAVVLGPLVNRCVIIYIDDLLVFGRTAAEFVEAWIAVLRALKGARFKVNIKKTVFFALAVKYCGRIYSRTGVRFDPTFVDSVGKMPRPGNAAELRSYLAAAGWLRSAIPNYAALIQPLLSLQTAAGKLARTSTTASMAKVPLTGPECQWTVVHEDAFKAVNAAVAAATELAYPADDKVVCVFTDASAEHWAGVVTQTAPDQLVLPVVDQRHEPLAFVSGHFDASQRNWPTIEKEGFGVKETIVRCSYLLQRQDGFHLYTDHRNLTYIFSADVQVADGRKQAAERLERWATTLRRYNYAIHHVDGEQNVTADLLSRWGASPVAGASVRDRGDGPVATEGTTVVPAFAAVARHVSDGLDASTMTLFSVEDLPTPAEIGAAQQQLLRDQPSFLTQHGLHVGEDGLLVDTAERVFVPDVRLLRLRMLIVAHQGPAAHRGSDVTYANLKDRFTWPRMREEVGRFCHNCLQCLKSKGGKTVPRPLLQTLHASSVNEWIHFDFIYIRALTPDAPHPYTYVLALMDNFSRFVELVPAASADTEVVAMALLDWFKRFGVVKNWFSDQGTHFNNELLQRMKVLLRCDHHFTAVYAPWSNGRVERLNRELKEILSLMVTEARLPQTDWPWALPAVNAALNNTPSRGLGGYAPITVFTGRPRQEPVELMYRPRQQELLTLAPTSDEYKAAVLRVQQQLHDVHEKVEQAYARDNPVVEEEPLDIHVGDYVLTSTVMDTVRDKTKPRWEGPAVVLEKVNERRFKVKDIGNDRELELHANHLRKYADSDLVVTQEMRETAAHGGRGYVLDHIDGHRKRGASWDLHAVWEAEYVAADWEPIERLFADAPTRVRSYIRLLPPGEEKKALQRYIGSL